MGIWAEWLFRSIARVIIASVACTSLVKWRQLGPPLALALHFEMLESSYS